MENEINSKLDLVLKELRVLNQLLRQNGRPEPGRKTYDRAKIDTHTELVNSEQALALLKFWIPEGKTKPNSRLLLPYVREGCLPRIKIKGNRYLYRRSDVDQLFETFFK